MPCAGPRTCHWLQLAMTAIRLVTNSRPQDSALSGLWSDAWGTSGPSDWNAILSRSLCFVCAFDGDNLVGFVNVAWDGGIHASIFDTCVRPNYRRQGIATALVRKATEEATSRGAEWLHVDFEPHLAPFYRQCGFRPTEAGLVHLPALIGGDGV
jgi:ribosomal protein S18 acetylase RimI-like enzyme